MLSGVTCSARSSRLNGRRTVEVVVTVLLVLAGASRPPLPPPAPKHALRGGPSLPGSSSVPGSPAVDDAPAATGPAAALRRSSLLESVSPPAAGNAEPAVPVPPLPAPPNGSAAPPGKKAPDSAGSQETSTTPSAPGKSLGSNGSADCGTGGGHSSPSSSTPSPPATPPDGTSITSPTGDGDFINFSMAPPDVPNAATPPEGARSSGEVAGVAYVDRHVTDVAGLVAALDELTRNLTAAASAGAGASAAVAGGGAADGSGGTVVLRGRIFLAPGVYNMSGSGTLRVGLGLELIGGRRAEEAAAAAEAVAAAMDTGDGALEAEAPLVAATDAGVVPGGNISTGARVALPAGQVAAGPNSTTQGPPAAGVDVGSSRRSLSQRRLLQAAAAAAAPEDHGGTVLDCGGSGEGALVMAHGGFALRDLVFTRCGGAAPVLVDFGTGSSNGSSGSSSSSGTPPPGGLIEGCVFEGNAGTVSGGVAVQPGGEWASSLRLAGCVFRNNSGVETPGDYVYDYDYSSGVVQRPVVPASALALGRGTHHISGCVFEDNAPLPLLSGSQQAWYNASTASATVDFSCWQGPASLHIEDSVFTGNTGRQSGAVYLHGHLDGATPSLGCDLTLRGVTLARNGGHQAGAMQASCPVKGSNCELSMKDTAVVENRTPQSGAILMRGSGMVFAADNLTLAHNVGGGLGFVDVGTTVTNSRIENNTATSFGGVSGWGGYFDATNTRFIGNGPTAHGAKLYAKASAHVLSNSYGNKLVNCTFEGNRGHALYVYAADITVRNSRFLRNTFIPGARNSNGGALMLFDLVLLSSIESSLFEGNAAVVGGAVMLYSSQQLRIADCTFRSNYALSGAGLTIDVPVAEIDVANSSFINNTAFGSAQELLAAAGINITATAPATTPSPAAALAVAAPSAPPPTAPAGTTLMPPLPVPTMPYAVISPSGSSDYQSSDADAGGDVPDYGSSMGSNIGSGSSRQGVAIDSILAPPESCGAGGGGGLCIRGAQDVTVTLANVSLVSNTALLGGGLYVGVGSRCRRLIACYRLKLDERVVVTGNAAVMAGGGVYWEYEKILQLSCSGKSSPSPSSGLRGSPQQQEQEQQEQEQTATRLRLAAPAWPGLLRQLQTHTFAPLSTSAGTPAAAASSNGSATATRQFPSSADSSGLSQGTSTASNGSSSQLPPPPPNPPSPPAPGGGGGASTAAAGLLTSAAAMRAYLRRVTPCAVWANNTVAEGGYGPTIASTVFFHQPLLRPAASTATSRSATAMTLPLPSPQPLPQPQLPQPAAAARRTLRQLLQLVGSAAAAAVAAVAPPLALQPPLPLAPPPPPASTLPLMFESGAALPVVVQVFDFYGQKVTRSVIDSSVLIMCTSLNALGQKAAQAEAGTANFSQLRLRDQVNASYELQFEGRTSIRQLGPVGLAVTLRPCRINEELSAEGDFCSPCSQDFYSYGGAGGCLHCPDGAACSNTSLGGVLVPADGFWHSSPLSANVIECPYEGACQYDGRLQKLATAQTAIIASASSSGSSSSGSSNSSASSASGAHHRRALIAVDSPGIPLASAASELPPLAPANDTGALNAGDGEEARYRQLQCAEGYWGNLCGGCQEGYGRQASGGCQKCRAVATRVGWVALAFAITFVSVVAAVRAALTPEFLHVAAADARRSRRAVVTLSANTYNTTSTPAATPGGDLLSSPGKLGAGDTAGFSSDEGGDADGKEAAATPAEGPTAAAASHSPREAAELAGAAGGGAGPGGPAAAAALHGGTGDAGDAVGGADDEEDEEGVPLGQLSGERFAAALFRIHGAARGRCPPPAGAAAAESPSGNSIKSKRFTDLQNAQAGSDGDAAAAEGACTATATAAAAATGAIAGQPATTSAALAAASRSGSVLAGAPSSSSQSGSWHQLFSLATPKSRIQLLKRPWERAAGALAAAQSRGRRSPPLSAEDMSKAVADMEAAEAADDSDPGGGGSGSGPVSQEATVAAHSASANVRGGGRRGSGGYGGGEGPTSQDSVSGSFTASAVSSATAASGSQQPHAPMLGMLPAYGKVSFASLLMAVRATKQPSIDGSGGAGGGGGGSGALAAARTSSGRPSSRRGSLSQARSSGVVDSDAAAAGGGGGGDDLSNSGGAPRRRVASRFAAATHAATAVQAMRKRAAATHAARASGSGKGTDTGGDSGGPSASAPGRLGRRVDHDGDAAAASTALANAKASAGKWHKRRASALADAGAGGSRGGASEQQASGTGSASSSGRSGAASPAGPSASPRRLSKLSFTGLIRTLSPTASATSLPPPPPRGPPAALSAFAAGAKRFFRTRGGDGDVGDSPALDDDGGSVADASASVNSTSKCGSGGVPVSVFTRAQTRLDSDAAPAMASGQAPNRAAPVLVDVVGDGGGDRTAAAGRFGTTTAAAVATVNAAPMSASCYAGPSATDSEAADSPTPTAGGKGEARSWGAAAAAALHWRAAAGEAPLSPRALKSAHAVTGPADVLRACGGYLARRAPDSTQPVGAAAAALAPAGANAGAGAGSGAGPVVDPVLGEEVGSAEVALQCGPQLVSEAGEAASPTSAAAPPAVPASAAAEAAAAAAQTNASGPPPLPLLPPPLAIAGASAPPHSALSGVRRVAGAVAGGAGGLGGSSRPGGGRMVSFAAGTISPVASSSAAAAAAAARGAFTQDRDPDIRRSSSYSRQRAVVPPAAVAIPTPSAYSPGRGTGSSSTAGMGIGAGAGGVESGQTLTLSRLRAASMPRWNEVAAAAVGSPAAAAGAVAVAASDAAGGHRLPPAALMKSRSFGGGRLRHRRSSGGGGDSWLTEPSAMAKVAAAAAVALHQLEAMPRSPAVLTRGSAATASSQAAAAGESGGAPPPGRMAPRAELRIGIPSPPDRVTSLDRATGSKYKPTGTIRAEWGAYDGHHGKISESGAAGSVAGSRCSSGGGDGAGKYGSHVGDDYVDDDVDGDSGGDDGRDGGSNEGGRPDSSFNARRRSELYGTFGGRQWRRRTDVISEHQTVFKILVSYVQVVSLVNNTPVTWPTALVTYFNVASQASSATSSLASLDCSMSADVGLPKSAQLFLIQVLAPAFWSAALVLFWLARAGWRLRRGRLQHGDPLRSYLHNRIIISVNCIIFVMYPSVVTQLFSLFSCTQLDTGPPERVCPDPWRPDSCRWDRNAIGLFWTQDLEQRCYRGIHLTLCAAVGVPGVVLFAAGIPLLSAWWLWRNRAKLWDNEFVALYGSLYQEYEDDHYYWESVVMLRKLTVTAVIVFAGTYRWQLTLLLSMGVIATSLLLQVAYRPYETDAMDELERLGLVATLMTFYLATYFMDDSVGRGVRVGLSFAILVINAATVFIMCVAIARELHRAALFRLLRISSARGDLPLSFVMRVGLLYSRWRGRVALTRLRTTLYRTFPWLFPMEFPPDADPVFVAVARSEAAAAASTVLAAAAAVAQTQTQAAQAQVQSANGVGPAIAGATGVGDSPAAATAASPAALGSTSSRGLLARRRAASAAAQVLAAALRGAWEHHHHGVWLLRVFELSERVSAAEEHEQRKKRRRRWSVWRGSGHDSSGGENAEGVEHPEDGGVGSSSGDGNAGWRQAPGKLLTRMRTVAHRLPGQLTHTASRLTLRLTHRPSDFAALDADPLHGGGAAANAGGSSVRRRQQSYRQCGADEHGGGMNAAPYSPVEITTPVTASAPDAVISAAATVTSFHMASRPRSSRTLPASGLLLSSYVVADTAAAGGAGMAGAAAATTAAAAVTVGPGGVRLASNPVALDPELDLDADCALVDDGLHGNGTHDEGHRKQRSVGGLVGGAEGAGGERAGSAGSGSGVGDGTGMEVDEMLLGHTWGPLHLLPEQRNS